MSWYRVGTISLTKNKVDVVGVGTSFKSEVRHGDILLVGGVLYEIARVESDTALRLVTAFTGASVSGSAFAIIRNMTNASNFDLMRKIEEFLSDRQRTLDEFTDWLAGTVDGGPAGDGKYPLTDRYGVTTQAKSIALLISETSDLNYLIDQAEVKLKALGDQQAWAEQILGYKDAAVTAAITAIEEAAAASTSATNAADSALRATTEANTAKIQATAATTKASAAASSAGEAQSSAAAAAGSAAAAATSTTKAGQWADANEGAAVEPGKYSAKHHALKAAASATSATGSAGVSTTKAAEAGVSATAAATSAAEALDSASTAGAKATQATGAAATATTKAGEASASASAAAASAGAASTSSTKAEQWAEANEGVAVAAGKYSAKHHALKSSASATAAQASATVAGDKASEAAASAASADSSADAASSSATVSSTKAAEAEDSASSAASSATTASTKAAEASNSAAASTASASTAAASESKAAKWAEANEGVAVESGKYSAKHHALKAASSATTANTRATTATTKADEASASAAAAAASTSAAAASAATATAKANEADVSANRATAGANTAITKADEASASAAASAVSASTAIEKSAEARASATAAETSAIKAEEAQAQAEAAREDALTAAATVTGALVELGSVDLSSDEYPTKPKQGAFWKVTAGGTVDGIDYGPGDTLVYSKNLDAFYKIDNTESVASVNGKKGVVVIDKADVGLDAVANVDTTNASHLSSGTVPSERLSGTYPISITGKAATVTGRTINGTPFDASANITTASWGTKRTLSFDGDAVGAAEIDGSANVNFALSLVATGVAAGIYSKVTVDDKGRVTAGAQLVEGDIPALSAAKIASGVLAASRIPTLAMTKITGLVDALDAKALAATQINAGTGLTGGGPLEADVSLGISPNVVPITASNLLLSDLDTVLEPGFYYQSNNASATAERNYPADGLYAGSLVVTKAAGIIQEYTLYGPKARKFVRGHYTAWSAWKEVHTTGVVLNERDIPGLDAAKIVSGTLAAARIPTLNQSTTGNAATATKLKTARKVTVGDTAKDFDGTTDLSWTLSEVGAAAQGHGHEIDDVAGLPAALNSKASGELKIVAGTGLTGGGNLTSDRTIAIAPGASVVNPIALGTQNLDTVLTDGEYTQASSSNATTDRNYPVNVAGSLRVTTAGNTGKTQEYRPHTAPEIYVRSRGASVWSSWAKVYATGSLINVADIPNLSASKITSGTLADARLSGMYSGITLKINGANTVFTTPSAGSVNGEARTVFGLAEFRGSASAQVGAIVFIAPNADHTVMHDMEIAGLLYANSTVRVTVQGYRLGATGSWTALRKISTGTADVPVRWGLTPDGKACVILGDVNTTWSYPHFSVIRAMFSHSGASDAYCSGWTTALVTDLAAYTRITDFIADSPVVGSISGNAATATKLTTARTINGVAFDGTANITTTRWGTARVLSYTGDVTGSASIDGSANVAFQLTLANSGVAAGTYKSVKVDAKGRVIEGAEVITGLITSSTSTGVSNVATTNGNTFLNITEKVGSATASAGTSTQITGAGTVTVESDTAGKITITGAQNITGNAATATKLATARTINGTAFDGTANITITAAANGGTSASCSGNAATATKLATARTINGVAFDGTANITVSDSTKLPTVGGTLTGNLTVPSVYCSDWFRSRGQTGWYSETYSGGIHMTDTTWVRVYNSKSFYVAGNIAATGNVSAYYSDERLKENIRPIDDALSIVCSWRGVRYNANEIAETFGYDRSKSEVGLLAQDVQRSVPEAVQRAPFDIDGETGQSATGEDYLTLQYERLVPVLVEAIKTLEERLRTQEALVASLSQRIAA